MAGPAAGQGTLPHPEHQRQHPLPRHGATYQPRAGIAKHDHVAWAFARKCDELGVDIIQNCEVTGFLKDGNKVVGVKTNRGTIHTEKVGLCAAGHSSVLAEMAGFRLPIQSHPLQALVSELHEPVQPTVVMSNHVHVYVSQAHKGNWSWAPASTPTTATASADPST